MRFLEKSKEQWKSKAQALEKENAHLKAPAQEEDQQQEAPIPLKKRLNSPFLSPDFSVYPRQHTYSLGLITLSLLLQVSACVGLRGVEKIMQIMTRFFPFSASIPSWGSHRLWLLRVGYYKLTRPKEIADDWVWIVDLTIQGYVQNTCKKLSLRVGIGLFSARIFDEMEQFRLSIPKMEHLGPWDGPFHV